MLNINNLNKSYNNNAVFSNFNISFRENKVSAIMGNSGIGKTTLLNCIAHLTSYEGEISDFGKISYVFQSPRLIPNLTVAKNVEYVIKDIIKDKNDLKQRVDKYLEFAEISKVRNSFPSQISGGERQRVQLARAFCYPSQTLLMDEPFSSLDIPLKMRLIDLYRSLLQSQPRTCLFVTHDPYEAILFAEDIFVLTKNGVMHFDNSQNNPKNNSLYNELYSALEK